MAKASDDLIRNRLASTDTAFGFKLLGELRKQDSGGNTFISPASVAIALAMTYNGASGDTQTAMARTLELNGMSLQEVNEAYAALRQTLTGADPLVQLTIANSLWVRQGETFKPDFLQRNQSNFGADIATLDFADPSAPEAINAWVNKNTNGKIQKIIDKITPEMLLFLVNAIYFKGTWTRQFDKSRTQDQPFHLINGSQRPVPMMTQGGKYQYLQGADFQGISLPYGSGRMSMYVLVPNEGISFPDFEQKLTAAVWESWLKQFHAADGTINLPRFKLTYGTSLNDALISLGMAPAFDPAAADFGAMHAGSTRLYISDVRHKTFLDVTEEGTEAAAVTSVGVGATALRPQADRFIMNVDRPFFMAIRDNTTGVLLFVGDILQP